jgi:hypothetical protein
MSRIVFVGRTDSLRYDFETMLKASKMPEWNEINYVAQHQNPPELEHLKIISPKGHAAVKQLLGLDYQVIHELRQAGYITGELKKSKCNDGQPKCIIRSEQNLYTTVTNSEYSIRDMSIEEYMATVLEQNLTWFAEYADATEIS